MKKLIYLVFLFVISTNILGQEKIDNLKVVEWSKDKVIYEVNVRQFTKEGTFASFKTHLPRLKEMGVGILWFMPIQPIGIKNRKGTLGSYYSIKDYVGINSEFGTLDDFKSIVNEAHSLGMKVILDWVANHTSWDNKWVESNPEFFTKNNNGDFVPPVEDWADVIDLDYSNKELWKEMINAMKFWIEECNLDGFRCDVAAMVPLEFWQQARKELDLIKPVFMLAEGHEPFLHNKAFDMTYSWQLKDAMNDLANGKIKAKDIIELFEKEKIEYGQNSLRMLFTTNHDENSWNGTEYERLGDAVEIFAVLCAVSKDMLLIYSGQEAGLNKRLEFFEKDEIEWHENKFKELFTKLAKLKKENPALWNGEYGSEMLFHKTANPDVIVMTRTKDSNNILTLFNLSNKNQTINIDASKLKGNYKCFIENKEVSINKKLDIKLTPWQYNILIKN